MNQNDYQPMPSHGNLAKNLNLECKDLLKRVAPFLNECVYAYVITTIHLEDGLLYQKGSGPNFQGDLITLCSCKHKMRTYRRLKSGSKGIWVAGYTRKDLGNKLFYLMRVAETFDSHKGLWYSGSLGFLIT